MKTVGKRSMIFLGVGLICAIILIVFGGSNNSATKDETAAGIRDYEEVIERRLVSLISSLEGVSDVNVMVIAKSGVEYLYAQNTEENDGNIRRQYYSTDERDALLLKEISPEILGAAIVCNGGEDVIIKQKILELVSSMTGLPSSKIYVGK